MNIKPISTETTLTSATTVDSATLVRLLNTSTATLITIKEGLATVATFTIAASEVVLVEKDAAQTLEGGAAIKAVKVAFSN